MRTCMLTPVVAGDDFSEKNKEILLRSQVHLRTLTREPRRARGRPDSKPSRYERVLRAHRAVEGGEVEEEEGEGGGGIRRAGRRVGS
jgi:hypothetical protein